MRRLTNLLIPLASLALLSACDLFNDKDWREGEEAAEKCAKRMSGKLEFKQSLAQPDGLFVPTYTFDITKMDLEAMQELIVPGSDETAGARNQAATNETSTAVANFMAQPVDEKGAFFLGRDPALYRVRGQPKPLDDLIAAGCARQQAGMRLTDIKTERAPPGAVARPTSNSQEDTGS